MSARTVMPTQDEERRLVGLGYARVAGLDEVGRGPLAGPVVAAAVVLPDLTGLAHPDIVLVRDSKLLSHRQRERAALLVQQVATASGVGEVSSADVDRLGIVPATRLAMERALQSLPESPDHLLVDALTLAWRGVPCAALVRGDRQCTAIAAASVVAKIYRDALMVEMDAHHPGYGVAANKGYPSKAHLEALERLGPCLEHRHSFAPVRRRLELAEAHA